MTLHELKTLYEQDQLSQALVVFDLLSKGWIVDFKDPQGRLYELTDTYGCRASFETEMGAEEAVRLIGDCPIQIDKHQRLIEP